MPKTAQAQLVQLGENVTAEDTGDEIILRINKKYRGSLSSSGKTVRVASTLGNKEFADIKIGLNAYVKPTN